MNVVDYTEKELRTWSRKKILKCPICEERLIYKHGLIKVPHFAHEKDSDCTYTFYENETKEHHLSKIFIYKMLKDYETISNLKLEGYISETKQRPDLYFEHDGFKYVVECQCTPITIEEIKERKTLYNLNNIIDIWIFGTENFNEDKPVACQNFLENYLILNPFKESFVLRKQNYYRTYKKINKFSEVLSLYKNTYFDIEKHHDKALQINKIIDFLYQYLNLNTYSCISNNICDLFDENDEILIRIEPNDSKKDIKTIDEYMEYLAFTGSVNIYLKGSEFNKLTNVFRNYRYDYNVNLPFKIINNRGQSTFI